MPLFVQIILHVIRYASQLNSFICINFSYSFFLFLSLFISLQDDFDGLRPLCYPDTDVFLICFSVANPTSFHNVQDKWLPEVRLHKPEVPVILIGTQCDLKHDVKVLIDLAQFKEQPVSVDEAKKYADKICAVKYIECSSLTQKNLKDVFDSAIVAGMGMRGNSNSQLANQSKSANANNHHNVQGNGTMSASSASSASKAYDLLSWGKYRSKKMLGTLSLSTSKDAKEPSYYNPQQATSRCEHSKKILHSNVTSLEFPELRSPTKSSSSLVIKKPRWKKLMCCL